MRYIKYILVYLTVSCTLTLSAQTRSDLQKEAAKNTPSVPTEKTLVQAEEEADTTKRNNIVIVSANSQKLDASTDTTLQYVQGDVVLYFDSSFLYCDTVVMKDEVVTAYGEVAIIKGDSLKLFADSLVYYTDSGMVYFYGYADGNVVLEHKENELYTNYLAYDIERDLAMYTNRGLLITPDSKLKSRKGFFHIDYKYANFYGDVTVEGKDYDILTDSLRYFMESKKAEFLAPVVVNQGTKRIYSESGFYDLDDNNGEFVGNAQYIEGEDISTADKIINNGKEELTSLLGNAKYNSEDEYGEADSIYYNQKTEKVRLQGQALFQDKTNKVTGEEITYDKATESMTVAGRSFLSNPPFLIEADDLDYNKREGKATADGTVVWQDTSTNYTIYADHIRYRDSLSFMKAYNDGGKPLLENMINDTDTLYLSGDTLFAYEQINEELDTSQVFTSHAHVKILMSDIQAVCDSMIYIEADSQFVLFQNPIMWSDSSQFSGDTIDIHMTDGSIDNMKLNKNATILSTDDFVFFNQIVGDNAQSYFHNKKIKKLNVEGNARSVYYLLDDDDAYIGVNETDCRRILFLFDNGDLDITRFYDENTQKLSPMDKANHESIKVRGFNWNQNIRPKTLEDLKK